jgi:ketosteroid isomerase-like protein
VTSEDLAVIARWVDAFNRRDLEAMAALSDPQCELRPYLASMIEHSAYRGHDGLAAYFRDADAAWERIQLALGEDFRELGERLVGSMEIYGKARASGLEVRVPVSWVAAVREGKVKQLHAYPTEAEALAAAG